MESQKNKTGCKKCISLCSLITDTPYKFKGDDFDGTIIIGESPHKDWKQSKSPFLNVNQKMNPSGRRLLEYLKLLGKSEENIVLLEAVRCVVANRKNLKILMENCRENLTKDIDNLHSNIVISLGKSVSDNLSKAWDKEFEPCNIYKINGFIFVPLYHPSPINPKNHTRNIEFLKSNAELILE